MSTELLEAQKAYDQAKASEEVADAEAARLGLIRRTAEENLHKMTLMHKGGRRPFLVGTKSYSGGDMMGKGGDTHYGSKIVWSVGQPMMKRRTFVDPMPYRYAFELNPGCVAIEKGRYGFNSLLVGGIDITDVAYIYGDDQIPLPWKKQIVDLQVSWNEKTEKFVSKWRDEIQSLRELLG